MANAWIRFDSIATGSGCGLGQAFITCSYSEKQYGSDTDVIPDIDDPKLYHGPGIPWYVLLSRGRYKYAERLLKEKRALRFG